MSATNRGTKRRDNDFYPTPDDAINALLDALPLRGGDAYLSQEPDPET